MKSRKRPKYERVLLLIKKRRRVTSEICQKEYPDISSRTFQSVVSVLYKSGLVQEIPMRKPRKGFRKTQGYSLEKAKKCLKHYFALKATKCSQ